MAALPKKGERNSLRFFVSERVVSDCKEPVRKGLSCQTRSNGVPTRKILVLLATSYSLLLFSFPFLAIDNQIEGS
jgi:hypothetical protein